MRSTTAQSKGGDETCSRPQRALNEAGVWPAYNRRAMRRGVLAGVFMFALLVAPAHAASDLEMRRGADGTWVVVGSGWRPGDHLVVSVGPTTFAALADGAGDFEVKTGLQAYQGEVAVHHQAEAALSMLALPSMGPNPLAVALVQGLAQGVLLTAALLGLSLVALGLRRWRRALPP
jgi:hypothetical protein